MVGSRKFVAFGCVFAMLSLAPTGAGAAMGSGGSGGQTTAAVPVGAKAVPKAPAAAKPAGVNPYLALVPKPEKIDYVAWRKWAKTQSAKRASSPTRLSRLAAMPQPILIDEDEPSGTVGSNDSPATAQSVDGFGTGANRNPRARILGTLAPAFVDPDDVAPNPEDDGAIPLAGDTGITDERDAITTTAQIGDGPHGSAGDASADFDFYQLSAQVGDRLVVDIDTPTGPLDSVVAVYTDAGERIAMNDDSGGLDSFLDHTFTTAGTFFVMISGFGDEFSSFPVDPFDSGSGEGVGSEGPYNVQIAIGDQDDVDFFAVRLRKGDVIGASITGAAGQLTIFDTTPREVHGSDQDATFIYPAASPLPGGGNAVTEHVAKRAGWHYVAATGGEGDYDITVEVYRPGLEQNPPAQTLFLDFDGARVNTAIWGGPGVRTLSPLRSFLGLWGLVRADENALITAIVAEVRENIRQDMVASGLNGRFQVRILNSRDNPDGFGDPNVTRVIVGGTIDESGLPTIGVAQSIDPGNFEAEESAVVLLDVLSGPADDGASLNEYITPASNKIGFIGQAVGNVISHEAGHMLGNWHVEQFNETLNLMDQGGNFALLYGVGPDGVGGTADDPDVDFGEDEFNPGEGFTGIEDTLTRVAFGLSR